MIDLRPARLTDSDNLFAWRNDPVTCANSRSTAVVPREDHAGWMKYNVLQGYPEHLVLIADNEHESVGTVRFDAEQNDLMSFRVSITIAPRHRGSGYARSILAEACSYMPDYSLLAEIRKDNTASRKIFERCGFEEIGVDHGFVNYRREPLS